ncbi:MAG: 1-(5-phosphoribosyl)-5-[(5-phosphoribosylamino)methylideneamino]imidazole-4-carboxamide isomerase [Syntrophomonadaceae bacterium]
MIIYPAIDLKEGQCVRLVQGRAEDKTVYSQNPAQVARGFEEQGATFLHVVDLDGAFEGRPANLAAIRAIAGAISIPFQVGGGLRTRENVLTLLQAGANRVIIGTRAVKSPKFIAELIEEFGPERIVLGVDARDGMVATEGWVETSTLKATELGRRMMEIGVINAVYTDVSRDGLLQGPNLDSIREMAIGTGLKIIASGGVSSLENIRQLREMEALGVSGAIIGKALYEGKIILSEALREAN